MCWVTTLNAHAIAGETSLLGVTIFLLSVNSLLSSEGNVTLSTFVTARFLKEPSEKKLDQ